MRRAPRLEPEHIPLSLADRIRGLNITRKILRLSKIFALATGTLIAPATLSVADRAQAPVMDNTFIINQAFAALPPALSAGTVGPLRVSFSKPASNEFMGGGTSVIPKNVAAPVGQAKVEQPKEQARVQVASLPPTQELKHIVIDTPPAVAPKVDAAAFIGPVDSRPLISPYATATKQHRVGAKRLKNGKYVGGKIVSHNAHLEAGLRRSAAVMKELNLKRDSVIAHYGARPITVAAALADRDIAQLPPVSVFKHWTASLEKYGFERQKYVTASYEKAHKLPNKLLAALYNTESSGFVSSISWARDGGALGPGQFMLDTARTYKLDNPFDIDQSLHASGRYMREALDKSRGNLSQAFARYNWGDKGVDRVIKHHKRFDLAFAPAETRGHALRSQRFMGAPAIQAIDKAVNKNGRAIVRRVALNPA